VCIDAKPTTLCVYNVREVASQPSSICTIFKSVLHHSHGGVCYADVQWITVS
jgi:hypothetical protein